MRFDHHHSDGLEVKSSSMWELECPLGAWMGALESHSLEEGVRNFVGAKTDLETASARFANGAETLSGDASH
jgi:hypothetical protein